MNRAAVNLDAGIPSEWVGMMGVTAGPAREAPLDRLAPGGFDAWMRAEQRRVFQLCYRLLGETDEADTATQEIFLKAFRALNGANRTSIGEPAAWLTRITVNACLDRLRSRRWRFWRTTKGNGDERLLRTVRDIAPSAEQRVFGNQIARRLAESLARLSERQRSVFVLKHYEDHSLEDIARLLGLDVGTVKAHLARALAKLRTQLKDLYMTPAASAGARGGGA
ncbi:MAG: RNA polymerase sigma factor [Bryobacterales bacterium]|nr:RNA polymerase sigma factor [Bryobacterales bacterium]